MKVYTHGIQSRAIDSGAMAQTLKYLEQAVGERELTLHYVTAREAYNIVKAAEEGQSGNPAQFRDYRIPQPNAVRYLSHKLRYLQGWFMFSPNPVMDDGTIVCDAVTVDGRRVDPLSIQWPPYTLRAPDFDLTHAKSFGYNLIWSDYFNRMHMGGNTSFR